MSNQQQPQMTKTQRKALAKKVAAAREAGKSGDAIRAELGPWLSGPERRKLLREFGYAGVIKPTYDRAEAKAKREAAAA